MLLRAAPGETIRLELPPPSNVNDSIKDTVRLKAAAQHQVSLILTASPLE